MEIFICSKPIGEEWSVEAGYHDGIKHFDHHGEFSNELPVCLQEIKTRIKDIERIRITHLDADTLITLMNIIGIKHNLSDMVLKYIGKLDVYGPETEEELEEEKDFLITARNFMFGVSVCSKEMNIPNCTDNPVNITKDINIIISMFNDIIKVGEENNKKVVSETISGIKKTFRGVVFVSSDVCSAKTLYDLKFHTVVWFNKIRKTISIYASNKSDKTLPDYRKKWNGIEFNGHAHACGSSRGVEMNELDGEGVYYHIVRDCT